MKKLFILGIACLFTQGLFAQQTMKFSMGYMPSKNYAMSYKMDMDMNMTVGDEATAKAMKDADQPSTMLMKMNIGMGVDIATSAIKNKVDVPFTMGYKSVDINMSMNGQTIPVPQTDLKGLNFVGSYSNTNKRVKLDGIQGGLADTAKTKAAEAQLAQILNQFNFPDTTLKVGDSFEQNMPFAMPTAGGNADVMTKIKYTLKEIKGNQAIFDLNQVLDMTGSIQQAGGQMVMKGTGKGTMVYDIAAQFPVSTNLNMDFGYNMNMGGSSIAGKVNGTCLVGVQITNK